jgi:hypothetical protein
MSFIINPYRFATGGGGTFAGYALYNGSSGVVYDPMGIYGSGLMTIPSEWDGRYVRFQGQRFFSSSQTNTYVTKNGSRYTGGGAQGVDPTSSSEGGHVISAPVVVSSGDYFAMDTAVDATQESWMMVEVMPSDFNGALVYNSSGHSITGSLAAVAFDAEQYDLDTFHDNSTNNSRITIGSGTTGLVRIMACIRISGSTSEMKTQIYKNGSLLQGMTNDAVGEGSNIVSYPIAVTNGDYFEIYASSTSSGTTTSDGTTWFAIEELPADLDYFVSHTTANRSIPSGSVWTGWTANSDDVDTGGWVSGSDSATVPSTYDGVRYGFGNNMSQGTGSMSYMVGVTSTAGTYGECSPYRSLNGSSIDYGVGMSGIESLASSDIIKWAAKTNAGATSIASPSTVWGEEYREVTS